MTLNSEEIMGRLQQIFRDVLDKPGMIITPKTTQSQIAEWDSMAQVHLIMSIEKEFAIRFTSREVGEVISVEAIVGFIEVKANSL